MKALYCVTIRFQLFRRLVESLRKNVRFVFDRLWKKGKRRKRLLSLFLRGKQTRCPLQTFQRKQTILSEDCMTLNLRWCREVLLTLENLLGFEVEDEPVKPFLSEKGASTRLLKRHNMSMFVSSQRWIRLSLSQTWLGISYWTFVIPFGHQHDVIAACELGFYKQI